MQTAASQDLPRHSGGPPLPGNGKAVDFGNLIALAARDRAPFRLTHYAQDLASLFHQFYTNCHVLTDDADVQTARLALCDATRIVLALSLNLLGVSAPVKM